MQFKTTFDEIVDVNRISSGLYSDHAKVIGLAGREEQVQQENKSKRLLIAIDMQNDFVIKPSEDIGAGLSVNGADEDIKNLTRFIYDRAQGLDDIVCSFDFHNPISIFFASMWQDKDGNHPDPYSVITYEDMMSQKYRFIHGDEKKAQDCLRVLEISGKGGITIWPYHCLIGSFGSNLEGQLLNMLSFYSVVTNHRPTYLFKGQDQYSEMYGIIEPEYNPNQLLNNQVLELLSSRDGKKGYDEIFIAGEASSHCVLESVTQVIRYFKNREDIVSSITVLTDCMSPVSGFEEATNEEFDILSKEYGIKLKKSSEIGEF